MCMNDQDNKPSTTQEFEGLNVKTKSKTKIIYSTS